MTATISLEGMRFFAHHGFHEEETILGNQFILDVHIISDVSEAATLVENATEQLVNTINYETVYDICRIQMKETEKLLETVLSNILLALQWQFPTIQSVKIKIRKLNPPMGGQIDASSVEMEESYVKKCGRCARPMICYLPVQAACWCIEIRKKIHPRTMEMLRTQYKGCLCEMCLREYAG